MWQTWWQHCVHLVDSLWRKRGEHGVGIVMTRWQQSGEDGGNSGLRKLHKGHIELLALTMLLHAIREAECIIELAALEWPSGSEAEISRHIRVR